MPRLAMLSRERLQHPCMQLLPVALLSGSARDSSHHTSPSHDTTNTALMNTPNSCFWQLACLSGQYTQQPHSLIVAYKINSTRSFKAAVFLTNTSRCLQIYRNMYNNAADSSAADTGENPECEHPGHAQRSHCCACDHKSAAAMRISANNLKPLTPTLDIHPISTYPSPAQRSSSSTASTCCVCGNRSTAAARTGANGAGPPLC